MVTPIGNGKLFHTSLDMIWVNYTTLTLFSSLPVSYLQRRTMPSLQAKPVLLCSFSPTFPFIKLLRYSSVCTKRSCSWEAILGTHTFGIQFVWVKLNYNRVIKGTIPNARYKFTCLSVITWSLSRKSNTLGNFPIGNRWLGGRSHTYLRWCTIGSPLESLPF